MQTSSYPKADGAFRNCLKDLVDIPLLPAKYAPQQEMDRRIEDNAKKAYLKLLAEHTASCAAVMEFAQRAACLCGTGLRRA